MKHLLILLTLFAFWGCKQSKETNKAVDFQPSKLITLFKASQSNYPNISVHRGGVNLFHYPENCLETIQYVSDSISAVYEVDVAQTKDGQLVLLHDNSIDRTTTGSGKINNLTYNELLNYNLVDDFGNETEYKIPLFSETLAWCKSNNIILTIDIKPSVEFATVINAIRKAKAEDISIIITYDIAEAKLAYKLAPDLLLSVSARNHEEFDRLLKTEIPVEHMIAFTGTRLSNASLYKRLHDNNIVCMLGTLGNLDKRAKARGDDIYKQWNERGADIMATDRPFEAFKAINN